MSVANRLGVGLRQYWGKCPSRDVSDQAIDIWGHLFGKDNMIIHASTRYDSHVPSSVSSMSTGSSSQSTLVISNEVPGYKPYATRQLRDSQLARQLFETSIGFYRQLRRRFLERHYELLRDFTLNEGASFFDRDQYVVIGVHVRAGNGETGEFVQKGRAIEDMNGWLGNMTAVVTRYIADEGLASVDGKKILVYVATDTSSAIEQLRAALADFDIQVISYPQHRSDEVGPSYQVKGQHCLESWDDQMIDMILLSLSDATIAARYSSFTQTIPMTLQFGEMREQQRQRHGKVSYPYCELSQDGNSMSCFKSFQGWKSRTRPSNPHRIVYGSSGRVDWTNTIGNNAISDGHEDTLIYPLATENCLDERISSENYFMNQDCLRAHLTCEVGDHSCQ